MNIEIYSEFGRWRWKAPVPRQQIIEGSYSWHPRRKRYQPEFRTWLAQNLRGCYRLTHELTILTGQSDNMGNWKQRIDPIILFRRDRDAALFKLFWG